MRLKNIHIHIDAAAGSGKVEAALVIKAALEAQGAVVEMRYPEDYKKCDEAFGFAETTVHIDLQTPKDLNL